jgi:hypothetical protein
MLRPDGLTGHLELAGVARDLVTAPNGTPSVVSDAAMLCGIAFVDDRRVESIQTEPGHAGSPQLVGARAATGFRKVLEQALPDHRDQRSALYQLLDDIPVVTLISGHALGAGQAQFPRAALSLLQRPNLCAGWREGGTIMIGLRRDGRPPVVTGPHAPRVDSADPLGWHPMAALPPTGMRRQRRLDVAREHGQLVFDAMFRDTYVTGEGVPTIIHEYVVQGRADAATLTITELSATPHVLPWIECPSAANSAADLVGRPLAGLRHYVRDQLTGVPSCTHLNDLLRSLEDVLGLAAFV